jgi:hypothetical protein
MKSLANLLDTVAERVDGRIRARGPRRDGVDTDPVGAEGRCPGSGEGFQCRSSSSRHRRRAISPARRWPSTAVTRRSEPRRAARPSQASTAPRALLVPESVGSRGLRSTSDFIASCVLLVCCLRHTFSESKRLAFIAASVSNVRQGVVDPRRARRAARAAWAASQCRGDAEGEARERPTHDARSCQVAVWLSEIDTVPIPQSLTRGIGYSGWPNGADPRHAEERKTYSLSSARTTFPRRQSGDRHRERFHRRRIVMGRVIAGPFVEIAQARREPKALRSCSAYPEIATDWHAPRSEEMPDSSKTLIVNDVNVGARHR